MLPPESISITVCGSCEQPINGEGWYHYRLRAYVHDSEECMSNLRGEDVRGHCMLRAKSER